MDENKVAEEGDWVGEGLNTFIRVKPGADGAAFATNFRKEMEQQLRVGNIYLKDVFPMSHYRDQFLERWLDQVRLYVAGIAFFLLVLFAALTSSIALTESAVSTLQDELGWGRKKATAVIGAVMLGLGSLSSLGYGPLAGVKIIGMQLLDFFDFLTNSVMMPIAAIAVCLLVSRVAGVNRIEQEVLLGEHMFRRKKVFNAMIRFLCPFFAAIILISSVANAFGWISM